MSWANICSELMKRFLCLPEKKWSFLAHLAKRVHIPWQLSNKVFAKIFCSSCRFKRIINVPKLCFSSKKELNFCNFFQILNCIFYERGRKKLSLSEEISIILFVSEFGSQIHTQFRCSSLITGRQRSCACDPHMTQGLGSKWQNDRPNGIHGAIDNAGQQR